MYQVCTGDKSGVPEASREPRGGLTILRSSERTSQEREMPKRTCGKWPGISHSHADIYSLATDKDWLGITG